MWPAMGYYYTVRQGDYLSKIAHEERSYSFPVLRPGPISPDPAL
jgi:hypothetical protein